VTHLVVGRLIARDDLLRELGKPEDSEMPLAPAHADEVKRPGNDCRVANRLRHPRHEAKQTWPASRDFHRNYN